MNHRCDAKHSSPLRNDSLGPALPSSALLSVWLIAGILGFGFLSSPACSQEGASPDAAPAMQVQPSTAQAEQIVPETITAPNTQDPTGLTAEEKEIRITAGLAAVVGIVVLGIGLISGILLWGSRLRRLTRQPSTPTPKGSEFWFLRTRSQAKTPIPPTKH